MSLVLRWRVPSRRIAPRWRGPAGMLEAVARDPLAPLAAVIGPPGPVGPGSLPVRIDAPLAATWVLANPLGRVPLVQAFLPSGEMILADVAAGPATVTVTHSVPQQGYVLLF